jgi:hypothetical protein
VIVRPGLGPGFDVRDAIDKAPKPKPHERRPVASDPPTLQRASAHSIALRDRLFVKISCVHQRLPRSRANGHRRAISPARVYHFDHGIKLSEPVKPRHGSYSRRCRWVGGSHPAVPVGRR